MCPLLQVLWLVRWDFALCRKILVYPNFNISAEKKWGVMLSPMHGERTPRAEAWPGGSAPVPKCFLKASWVFGAPGEEPGAAASP